MQPQCWPDKKYGSCARPPAASRLAPLAWHGKAVVFTGLRMTLRLCILQLVHNQCAHAGSSLQAENQVMVMGHREGVLETYVHKITQLAASVSLIDNLKCARLLLLLLLKRLDGLHHMRGPTRVTCLLEALHGPEVAAQIVGHYPGSRILDCGSWIWNQLCVSLHW